jgi:hypothetical protein
MLGDGPRGFEGIRSLIARLAPDRTTFAPLIAGFLNVDSPHDAGLASLDSQMRKRSLFETIIALVVGTSHTQPLLLVFEDLHWMDTSSLELLSELRSASNAKLLVCLTSRDSVPDELRPDLSIHIQPLTGSDARQLLETTPSLSPERIPAVLTRAQGNPLFLLQLALAGETESDLPESVSDVLMSRVDRLDAGLKAIVRAASVVGQTFDEPTVQSLLQPSVSQRSLRVGLNGLKRLGFLHSAPDRRGVHVFSHIVARDAVYESLPFAHRRRLHGSVLQHLESRTVPPALGPEVLLHRRSRGRPVGKYPWAGDRAATVFANYLPSHLPEVARSVSRSRWQTALTRLVMERLADCETLGQHRQAKYLRLRSRRLARSAVAPATRHRRSTAGRLAGGNALPKNRRVARA